MNHFAPEHSVTPTFPEFRWPTLHSAVTDYCWRIGIIEWSQQRPILDLAHRLVRLGNAESEAVRKACELADDVRRHAV